MADSMIPQMLKYQPSVRKLEGDFGGNSYERLKDRILARHPLIFVDTQDREYLDRILVKLREDFEVDERLRKLGCTPRVFEYAFGLGGIHFSSKGIDPASRDVHDFLFNSEEYHANDILVLYGYSKMFEDGRLAGWLRMIASNDMNDRPDASGFLYVLIVGQDIQIPAELIPYSVRMTLDKPTEKRIRRIYDELFNVCVDIKSKDKDSKDKDSMDKDSLGKIRSLKREVCRSLVGFSQNEIELILRYAFLDVQSPENCKNRILDAKREMIKRIGFLELVETSGTDVQSTFAGLGELRTYLEKVRDIAKLPDEERGLIKNYGLNGILLVGMPGCGKSMAAKTARLFIDPTWPLIKLDIGRLLGKYVGESEGNLRMALEIAERVSPCILWIDEMEKAFSGLDSSDGTSMRLFGSFLTWMQEKRESAEKRGKIIYVIATANNIDKLPDEFKRKGRFDEIFSILLPSKSEREAIFRFHLGGYERAGKLNLDRELDEICAQLAADTAYSPADDRGFSGADIATVVTSAAAASFIVGGKVTYAALKGEIRRFKDGKLTQRDLMCHGIAGKDNDYVAAEKKLKTSGFRPASSEK